MNGTVEFKQILRAFGLEYFARYYSVYRAVVVDNEDPEYMGRLKLKVPQVWGKGKQPEIWSSPMGMFSGNQVGFYMLPNVGDMVWCQFETGDARYPVWSYGHFLKNGVPDGVKAAKGSKIYILQTTQGSRMTFNDEEKSIVIQRKDGKAIGIHESGVSLGKAEKAAYHAILGEVAEECLEDLRKINDSIMQKVETYCATQNAAAGSVAILAPLVAGYTKLATDLLALSPDMIKLQQKITTIKSEMVTLEK